MLISATFAGLLRVELPVTLAEATSPLYRT
jgi:hypothetical protein